MARLIKSKDIFEIGGFLNHWFDSRVLANRNCLVTITGPTGCLSGDTKLYGQDKTLDELYKSNNVFVNTYSLNVNNGHSIKSKSEIIPSGDKEVFEIELEDGRKVKATENHKFFVKRNDNIIEVELKDLKEGDSLVSHKVLKFNSWDEEQDQMLKQFYYNSSREELIKLFNRNWNSIKHRAIRLKLKRNPTFQRINSWTNKNNPMHEKEFVEKVKNKLKGKPNKLKGLSIWKDKIHPKGMLGKKHKEETKKHISKVSSGVLSPHWLGGKSFEPYGLEFNKHFKKYIKNRDNNKCCLCFNNKGYLGVHHIDYNKLNSNEMNCITLCTSCHSKTNKNRTYWTNLFNKMIGEKYVLIKN